MSLHGLLLLEKGPGVTSFQVVAHLRRLLRAPKVGHGGTLDPMATGVLPILVGEATKLTPYLLGHDKEYVATLRLGVRTDTLDLTGTVQEERPVPPLEAGAVRGVLARFVGEIDQVPPMYSALHVGGRRLHELARAGVEVARAPRRVRIETLELLALEPPRLTLRVQCGPGTYIRSLGADLGEALGCGAATEALVRTRVGPFRLEDALPWAEVRAGEPDRLRARLLPPDRAVGHLPAVSVTPEGARRLANGQGLAPGEYVGPAALDPRQPVRLYAEGCFLGIGQMAPDGRLSPRRLLHADHLRSRPVSP